MYQTTLNTNNPSSSHLDLPGRDYYDQSLYDQRHDPAMTQPPPGLLNNQQNTRHEEERIRNALHPRVAMLKNTNIEKERRARQASLADHSRSQSTSPGKRVHYSGVDEYDRRTYLEDTEDYPGTRSHRRQEPDGRMEDEYSRDHIMQPPSNVMMEHGTLSQDRQHGRMLPNARMEHGRMS